MLIACVLAVALVAGVPWPLVAAIGLGSLAPWPAAGLLVVAAALARRRRKTEAGIADEAVFLAAMAAELRAGASLRTALCTAAPAAPALDLTQVARMARAGVTPAVIADCIAGLLPERGAPVAAALSVAGAAGGRAAAVFDRLAADAWAEVDAHRTHSALTAQARLSAWVVGGLPAAVLAMLAVTGRLGGLMAAGPTGMVLVGVGLVLELAGVAAVVALVRGVGR